MQTYLFTQVDGVALAHAIPTVTRETVAGNLEGEQMLSLKLGPNKENTMAELDGKHVDKTQSNNTKAADHNPSLCRRFRSEDAFKKVGPDGNKGSTQLSIATQAFPSPVQPVLHWQVALPGPVLVHRASRRRERKRITLSRRREGAQCKYGNKSPSSDCEEFLNDQLRFQHWGCTRSWEGAQLGELTPTGQRAIPYHMGSCSARKAEEEEGKGGHLEQWRLSSQAFQLCKSNGLFTSKVPACLSNTPNTGPELVNMPVPVLDNPFSEEIFPNVQSKPPLAQLEAISSLVESDEVSPQPPFLQAKQPQVPQPLPISLVLQTLPQLRCPSLDTLQPLNVSPVVGGPTLNTAFKVRPHQCPVQGHDHCPSPAGHTISGTSQDAIGFLGHLGTLLAHIQAAVNEHPQDLALSLVEPHTVGPSPSIQPVQVPLQSLPPLKQINTPAQLGVICKLTEGALDPLFQITHKDIKQGWPQHRALGDTTCDRLPTGFNSIHHHSLGPAIQPVLYPAKSTPIQAMSSQFLQENAVGNRVKGFTEV
ncbi:hypothetical protein QYF61_006884 [Mycteria americana]|uniref:Uncharacterized protein n=1 Tax=Mycteria americana TaxID=33587 RepID=A0AAN7RSQ9_MYCAM|nr:hypothetical protein QYF61_006884 [Mycteria americana]